MAGWSVYGSHPICGSSVRRRRETLRWQLNAISEEKKSGVASVATQLLLSRLNLGA
jgi:hypothetical protein